VLSWRLFGTSVVYLFHRQAFITLFKYTQVFFKMNHGARGRHVVGRNQRIFDEWLDKNDENRQAIYFFILVVPMRILSDL
jgi:hypothetical protein